MKLLFVALISILLSACVIFSPQKSIKKSDLKTVSVRETDDGWHLIHKRMAFDYSANESVIRNRLEKSIQCSIGRLCAKGEWVSDRSFEQLFLLDHAPEDKHHQYNLLARVICNSDDRFQYKVMIETLKTQENTYQIIGTVRSIKPLEKSEYQTYIKPLVSEKIKHTCPAKHPLSSVVFSERHQLEDVYDSVPWQVHISKVVATVSCQ